MDRGAQWARVRKERGTICDPFAVASVVIVVVLLTARSVAADPLLDTLHHKGVLTNSEYKRLQGTEMPPETRRGLIDVLRQKGLLTEEEAQRLEAGAATAIAPPPTPPAPAVAAASPAAPAPTPAAPSFQTGYDNGFFLRSPEGNVQLLLKGRVASNFYFFEPHTSQNDNITIDRARLSAEVLAYKLFRMKVENDFAFSSGLRDAWVAFTPHPAFNLELGQFKVPFSYEELMSKLYIDFVERAAVVTSTVNPSRDIGLMAYGQFANKLIQYQFAAMNGAGQNQSDNNSAKDFVGRVVITPFVSAGPSLLRDLNMGGAITYGHEPRQSTKQADGTLVYTKNSISGITETSFTFYPAVARHGDRYRGGAHIAWLHGPYSLSSEYIATREERNGLAKDGGNLPALDTEGAYVGGTWLLTSEAKPFNARVRAQHPLISLSDVGWGAWEAALRYEYYKLSHGPDAADADSVTNRYDAVVAGANWYPNEFTRFSLNYIYGTFDQTGNGGAPNPNKHSNNSVLGRMQLEF